MRKRLDNYIHEERLEKNSPDNLWAVSCLRTPNSIPLVELVMSVWIRGTYEKLYTFLSRRVANEEEIR